MAFSDDEDEALPDTVSEYYFCSEQGEPLSFFELPVQWNGSEGSDSNHSRIYLRGDTDNGLQKIYKQVKAWKYDISKAKPEVSVLSKDNNWIKLQKPRKSYENEIRTILITVHCLHFFKSRPEASEKALWDYLSKVFRSYDIGPSENDLIDHMEFIREAVMRDETIAKSKFLASVLDRGPRKRKVLNEDAEITLKPSFIVDDMYDEAEDDDKEAEDSDSEEEDDAFDSVCAICDNGGDLTCCEGKCLRSFHATVESAEIAESNCESLRLPAKLLEKQTFYCGNCRHNQHQCYICGELGSSDKSSVAEVFRCSSATCGQFYHPRCVAPLLHQESKAETQDLEEKIVAGEPFTCPAHKCFVCKQSENEKEKDLQFAVCRRCPRSYHRKCLPREIIFFKEDNDEDVTFRAWDLLLPKSRALIYCLDHEIIDELSTPVRNIKFPDIGRTKQQPSRPPSSKKEYEGREGVVISERMPGKRPVRGLQKSEKPSSAVKLVDSSKKRAASSAGIESSKKQKVGDTSKKPFKKTLSTKVKSTIKDDGKQSLGARLYEVANKSKKDLTFLVEDEQNQTAKTPGKENYSLPPLGSDSKKRILALMEKSASSVTLDEVTKNHLRKSPSTHAQHEDKSIALGRVEGSEEALRLAWRMIEEGRSVEDAKAVCPPSVIVQLKRWKDKLNVYLMPFLHGKRYTSYGRHFTQVKKLEIIVNRLRPYVEDGDMIVDFACGQNDFSCILKERLEEMGKKCFYKNYDIMPAKNDFNFVQKDWMHVDPKELPDGSKLIMGLNPPFGKDASLANQFIVQALKFKPKLLILIVPPETQRLDHKKRRTRYDLIWEDVELLSGKSFYLPGSVDIKDKQLDQWNNKTPPLYLWSRPDWTSKHKAIAREQGHLPRMQQVSCSKEGLDLPKESPDLIDGALLLLDNIPIAEKDSEQTMGKATARASGSRKEASAHDNGVKVTKEKQVQEENIAEKDSEQTMGKATARASGSRKEASAHDNGGKVTKEKQVQEEKRPNGNSKKRNRGKRRSGSLERRHNKRHSPPVSRANEMQRLDLDFRRDAGQPSDRIRHEPNSHYDVAYGRTREDDVERRHSNNYSEPYSTPFPRPDGGSRGTPDYGIRRLDPVQFPGYERENIDSHRHNMQNIDGTNTKEPYACLAFEGPDSGGRGTADLGIRRPEPVQYSGYERENRDSLSYNRGSYEMNPSYGLESQRSSYLGGHHDPGFPSGYSRSADPSQYNRTSTSVMRQYEPRLDELNPRRISSYQPEPPFAGRVGGLYTHPVPGPGFNVDSFGFAPGPHRPYTQHNSSGGWINE